MSNQQPIINQRRSFKESARNIWLRLIEPHPAIKSVAEFRRAQLLSILTLILSVLFISALLSRPRSLGIFFALGSITLISYVLSKTKSYRLGIYILTYSFTAIGYIRIYQGTAISIESAITSTVHIALIFSSVLLSQRGFLSLAILSTIGVFMAPLYSHPSITDFDSVTRVGGVVLVIGALLYGIKIFQTNLEKEGLKDLSDANRELEVVTTTLEQRIGIRTMELEQANQQVQERATRLQIISAISQEISSNLERKPKDLFSLIARSISEKLGYYHVGIFLLDENREFAVLRAANSEGGQRMLERHHQLKVGGTGMVGYVAQGGRPRIALDTGLDSIFFSNPDLPGTRSEIALPLKFGSTTIGVLDVQSTLPSAFTEEDAQLLGTLTNQIAIVINTSLASEKAEYGISSQNINKRIQKQRNLQTQSGYSYLPDGTISSAAQAKNPAIDQVISSGETAILPQLSKSDPPILAVPVKFRDQVIGIIQIEATQANRKWTEDEVAMVQSISERAAYALENARLFEETVRRADQEETIARVTTQIGASTDFNRILQTTIQELGRVLGTSRSFIQLMPQDEDGKEGITES
jgi:GAF domain-containing protein